jgi:hypothetical protein
MSFAPWIKVETTTPDKPEVVKMALRLKVKDHDLIVGKLLRLWAWADSNSVDGLGVPITRAFIDRLVSLKGFASALEKEAKWISGPDGSIDFHNFERHNGDSAKRRAMETRKKQIQRGGTKGGTNVPMASGQDGGPEEEIEYLKEKEAAAGGDLKPIPPDPLLEKVRTLRTEYSSQILDERERSPFAAARPVMEAFGPEDWDVIRRYLKAKLPAGVEVYQPDRRVLFLQAAGEILGKAKAWQEKQSGTMSTSSPGIPAEFIAWSAKHYSLSPLSCWNTADIRAAWKASLQSDTGEEDAAA